MLFRSRLHACWLFFLLLGACCQTARAAEARALPASDSLVKAYYRYCKAHVHEPEVDAMCDTLFMRAAASGDLWMQTVALCLRLDHYYYRNDREKIIENVRRVQDFCRANGKAELNYFYYFVWSSRLITYYIKKNQSNVAVYETRRMLAEAEAENYA